MTGTALDLAGLVGLIAVLVKVVDFLKLVTNLPDTRTSVVTQLCVWVAGVGCVFLYAASQFGAGVVVSGVTLTSANWATKVLIGLAVGSSGSVGVSALRAVDGSQSAAVPPLRLSRRARPPEPIVPEPTPVAPAPRPRAKRTVR